MDPAARKTPTMKTVADLTAAVEAARATVATVTARSLRLHNNLVIGGGNALLDRCIAIHTELRHAEWDLYCAEGALRRAG